MKLSQATSDPALDRTNRHAGLNRHLRVGKAIEERPGNCVTSANFKFFHAPHEMDILVLCQQGRFRVRTLVEQVGQWLARRARSDSLGTAPIDATIAGDDAEPGYRTGLPGLPRSGPFPDQKIDLVYNVFCVSGITANPSAYSEQFCVCQTIKLPEGFSVFVTDGKQR